MKRQWKELAATLGRYAWVAPLFLFVLFAAVLSPEGGNAQDAGGGKPDAKSLPRITLGDSEGSPGETMVVPIYFAKAERVEVGSLKLVVRFVSKNLTFSKVSRGVAAESGNIEVKAEAKEGKNEKDLETTELTVTAEAGKQGLPGGLLGYITLNVGEKAGPANIMMRTSGEATELGTKKPIPSFSTVDAEIAVLAPGSEPLISCYFFSH
jgi:hypothetical protein